MTEPTCGAALVLLDTVVHCELPVGHDDPAEDAPQGSPHESMEVPDQLTDGPRRWWG